MKSLLSYLALVPLLSLSAVATPFRKPKVGIPPVDIKEHITHDKRSIVERDGVEYTVFEHAATNTTMAFVTNSGICETTRGVNQYSGYLSVGSSMNMWFW